MLKRIKDYHSSMYENEIYTLSDSEFKVLSFFRVKGGENSLVWFRKEAMQKDLNFGRDKLNSAINGLEEKGAIIVFTCKAQDDMTFTSNVYYICEYDEITKSYITANTIDDIKKHALDIRESKEEEFALKNNLSARNFVLLERPLPSARKIKYVEKTPPTENPYKDNIDEKPPTEKPHVAKPNVANKHIYITKPSFTKLKSFLTNSKNNNKGEINVVVLEDLNLVKSYILDIVHTVTPIEVELITKDILTKEKELSPETLNIRFNAIRSYISKNNITNVIGLIRKAIKEQWSVSSTATNTSSNFNNYEQRTYDFVELEKKLLGWK